MSASTCRIQQIVGDHTTPLRDFRGGGLSREIVPAHSALTGSLQTTTAQGFCARLYGPHQIHRAIGRAVIHLDEDRMNGAGSAEDSLRDVSSVSRSFRQCTTTAVRTAHPPTQLRCTPSDLQGLRYAGARP